jgi:hypothetical protein
MRNLIPIFALFLILLEPNNIKAQRSIDQIVQKLKETNRYEGFEIPGYVLRWTTKMALWVDKDANSEDFYKIIKKVKGVSVSTTSLDQKKYNNVEIVNNLAKKLENEDSFKEYMSFKNKRENIKILVNENKDIIKNIVILSNYGRELNLIHFKTSLHFEDLKTVDFKTVEKEIKKVKIKTEID